jgi:hypothetical protein
VAHDIHIRTIDGSIEYQGALDFGLDGQLLWVLVGDDAEHADKIYFSPFYWQQYVVDPHREDPLDLEYPDDEDEDEDD